MSWLLLGLLFSRAWALPSPPACPGCNVIVITIDILRADELAAGGNRRGIMPHLDELAARSAYFPEAFSPSPDSTPANVSILSGLYSWKHGVRVPLRDRAAQAAWSSSPRSLPGILKEAGYSLFSSELGEEDVTRRLGKEVAIGPHPGPRDLKNAKKFFLLLRSSIHDPYFSSPGYLAAMLGAEPPGDLYPSRADVLKCAIISLATGKAPASPRGFDRKEILTVSNEEESKLLAAAAETDPQKRLAAYRAFDLFSAFYPLNSQCFWSFFSKSTVGRARDMYDAEARSVDDLLGRALDKLSAEGLLKNTLVVVTSQHGDEFFEHGLVTHAQQLYRETVGVPLLFSFPDMKEGVKIPGAVSTVDVMPTVLQALGLQAPQGLDGRSLLECLTDRCRGRYAFSEFNGQLSVRDDDFTYLRLPSEGGARELLFDRRADPGELKDIAARRPKDVARLRVRAVEAQDWKGPPPGEWPDWADEKLREQVISTGYW